MEPQISIQPQQNRHILRKIIITVILLIAIAGVSVLVFRAIHQASLVSEVKTELIKQNKIIKSSAKDDVFPSSAPQGVASTKTVRIDASLSAAGTAYCVTASSMSDSKVVYHMDKATPDEDPAKGSCSDTASVPPLTPSNFVIDSAGAGAVGLSWQSAPYAATYKVQCANNKDFTAGLVSKTTDVTTITVSDLAGGDGYYCRVAASNVRGQSVWSPIAEPQTRPISTAPADLKITTISSTALRYTWKPVAGASEYVVEYSEDINFLKNVVRVTTKTTSGDATGLKPNTAYYFHVKAVTAGFDADHATFSGQFIGRTAKI